MDMNVPGPQASGSHLSSFNEITAVYYEETELPSHSACCL